MVNSTLLQMLASPRETGADEKFRTGVLRGYLENNGEAALGGDPAVLGKVAGYDPKLAIGLQDNAREQKKFGMAEAEAKLDKLLGVVQWADNPAKWGQAMNMLTAQGYKFDPGEDLFENRDATLARGLGFKQQLAQMKDARDFAYQQNRDATEDAFKQQQFGADQAYRNQSLGLQQQGLDLRKQEMANKQTGPHATFKDVTTIRKEIGDLPSFKSYSSVIPVYNSMVKASDNKAGDLNLVYGLAKMYDPTSVVREGEQVLVRDTASLPDWLIGNIQSVNGGARLLPDTRKAIIGEARTRAESYKDAYEAQLPQYRDLAKRYGIEEGDIIPQMQGFDQYQDTAPEDDTWTTLPNGIRIRQKQ